MQVEVFSDVVCPWCYIGKRRLERALAEFPHRDEVTVTYRSFQLDPTTPRQVTGSAAERLADKYGTTVEKARAMMERTAQVAAGDGLTFDVAAQRPANTFDAHRLLHFAAEHGQQLALKERLLSAYFEHGEHVGDADTLVALAAEVGLDRDEAAAVLASDRYADAVRDDLGLARAFGISSVPFFVIDRRYGIGGAQEASVLAQALDNAWAEAHPLTMVGSNASTGAAEHPDDSCADGACAV